MITRRNALLAGLGLASSLQAATPHPLYFEPNRGQFGSGPVFCSDQKRWRASFEARGLRVEMKRLVGDGGAVTDPARLRNLRLSLVEAACPAPVGEDKRIGRSDYYFHGDPKTFVENVPHFYRLRYREAWPGVDMVVRGWKEALEISFTFSGGADASAVGLRWLEGEPLALRDGSVVVTAPWGVVRQPKPAGLGWRVESSGILRLA
ncbi:MAG: hypothetical protein KDC27_16460 [Acidobacteria bacterium]|nr:hypothetical protein [Acidobacteriota bacterium]